MELTGKVIAVLDLKSGSSKTGNEWKSQDFVIETDDRFSKKVCFRLFGNRVNDCPNVGDEVTVSFDAESREWNGKWFTQLNAWKVENNGGEEAQPASSDVAKDGKDDLPF